MASYSGSGSGDGGSTKSKKAKQKKVPQRGLGVAQLERIREEEQKKREKGEMGSSFSESNSSVQSPNIQPGPALVAIPSNHLPSIPNFANLHRSSGQNSKRLGEIGYNVDGDKREFTFLPQVNLHREALNFHTMPHRSHIFQFSPNTMVNTTSGFSASLPSSQLEPPSNQIFRDDNYTACCSEADKMVIGVKRSYPFSLETTPVSSSHSNFPIYASSRSRSDEIASFSNGYAPQMESRNKYKREIPSNSISPRESERGPSEAIRDDEILNGHFLTLAPPAAVVSSPSNSKYSIIHEQSRNQIHRLGSGESTEQPFCFFPEKLDTEQINNKAEKSASIDLNLKL